VFSPPSAHIKVQVGIPTYFYARNPNLQSELRLEVGNLICTCFLKNMYEGPYGGLRARTIRRYIIYIWLG